LQHSTLRWVQDLSKVLQDSKRTPALGGGVQGRAGRGAEQHTTTISVQSTRNTITLDSRAHNRYS
jgi:hypothetical protein